jgi:hypothetical protein
MSRPNGENRPRRPRHIAATALVALCLLIALMAAAILIAESLGCRQIAGLPVFRGGHQPGLLYAPGGLNPYALLRGEAKVLWSGKWFDVSLWFDGPVLCLLTRGKHCVECGAAVGSSHALSCSWGEPYTGICWAEGREIAGFGWYQWTEFPAVCPVVCNALLISLWSVVLSSSIPLVALGAHALYRRHRRRRPGLCPGCGYDLTGNVSGRCPECGATTSHVQT